MSTLAALPTIDTIADLLNRAGGVPAERVLYRPYPATEADLLAEVEGKKRLCELVDGVLVEKPMGFYDSRLAAILTWLLDAYAEEHDLGIVCAANATLRIMPGLVRLPDVSFFSWRHFPNRELPTAPILPLSPDLAVEVLSEGNTPGEMRRKLREYFGAGTRLVWYADPKTRTVLVYIGDGEGTPVTEEEYLDGGDVVPGFRLKVGDWFRRAGRVAPTEGR